jgi:hypothetical protein
LALIAEGYATAAGLSAALGFPTIAAFDAGNLAPAWALHEKFPDKPIIIAGDDDQGWKGVNPARRKPWKPPARRRRIYVPAVRAAGQPILRPSPTSTTLRPERPRARWSGAPVRGVMDDAMKQHRVSTAQSKRQTHPAQGANRNNAK